MAERSGGQRSTSPSAPFVEVMQMVRGFMLSQAVHAAAKLAVFDIVADAPRTVDEIAHAAEADAAALGRLLRFLTAVGLLREDERGRYGTTERGKVLQADHPQSARPLALMYGEALFWRPWGEFYETVKSGRCAFERLYGQPFFEHLATSPAQAATFHAGMTSATNVDVPAILGAYDFSGLARIVDVGGGQGVLLRSILARYPQSKGMLCDLPAVLSTLELAPDSRLTLVPADIFEEVPAQGDAYVLKRVLHDWDDASALRVLCNVRRAIAPNGKLLVMEALVKPANEPDPAKWMDLNMLALFSGRERTEEEFRSLYARAGFRLTRVVPAMALSILEGVPDMPE